MKTLPAQPLKDSYWLEVEAQIKSILYIVLFAPLIELLRKANPEAKDLTHLKNGLYNALVEAIKSGRIQYVDGIFSGLFSVSITKDLRALGATYDIRRKVYKLARVPDEITAASAYYQLFAQATSEALQRKINEIERDLEETLSHYEINADSVIHGLDHGFRQAAQVLQISPKLDRYQAAELKKQYTQNLKPYIKTFAEKAIGELRETVAQNAQDGYRFSTLTEGIKERYGVTTRKARFLARQETGLFMAKYREIRFTSAGIDRYQWSTAHDERVRASHAHLDGKAFLYSQPPVTDPRTGARNNPGSDFGCRCVDRPIIDKIPAHF